MCFGITTLKASNLQKLQHSLILCLFTSCQFLDPCCPIWAGGSPDDIDRDIGAPNREQREHREYEKEVCLRTLKGVPCAVTGMKKVIGIIVGQGHV